MTFHQNSISIRRANKTRGEVLFIDLTSKRKETEFGNFILNNRGNKWTIILELNHCKAEFCRSSETIEGLDFLFNFSATGNEKVEMWPVDSYEESVFHKVIMFRYPSQVPPSAINFVESWKERKKITTSKFNCRLRIFPSSTFYKNLPRIYPELIHYTWSLFFIHWQLTFCQVIKLKKIERTIFSSFYNRKTFYFLHQETVLSEHVELSKQNLYIKLIYESAKNCLITWQTAAFFFQLQLSP